MGHPFVYTVAVTNQGPGAALDVIIADQLASDLATQDVSPGCVVDAGGGGGATVVCAVGTIAVGGTETIIIEVVPNTTGTFANFAGVFQSSPDPVPQNNFQRITTTVAP